MKIDCPHCGVHGSVDDSLAGKKLRCPRCSKVFLVAEEVLLETPGLNLVQQETLHDSVTDTYMSVTEEAESANLDEPGVVEEKLEAFAEQEIALEETAEEPEVEEIAEEPEVEEAAEEEFEEDEEAEPEEEPLALEEYLKEAEIEEEEAEEDEFLAFTYDDEDDAGGDDAGKRDVLGTCDSCGESLDAEFLETVNGKQYCALCLPEDVEEEFELTDSEQLGEVETDVEEVELEESEETEESFDLAMESMEEDDDVCVYGEEEESLKEPCAGCGEVYHPDFMQEIDSKFYCGVCQPEVVETASLGAYDKEIRNYAGDVQISDIDFTVGELIKDAWQKTKGAKGSIWAGLGVMYLIILAISLGGPLALTQFYGESDPMMSMGINGGLQIVASFLSMIFTGGLMLIGVHQAIGQRVSWLMVFAGFSGSKILSMIIAVILQSILVMIGFVLLILPGIYLSIGYALALPLIMDKGLGPWEALETSRKAIHKKWWTVFGSYVAMMLLYLVSSIPLGLGLIWTVPMFFVMVGVLYSRLFVSDADLKGEDVEEYYEESEDSI